MCVRNEATRALVGPFDRTAKLPRAVHDAEMFRIGRLFHAVGAAYAAGQYAHLAEPEDALGANMERPMLAAGIVTPQPPSAAALH